MEYIYGALLLHKLKQPVTEENLRKVIGATGVEVDEAKIKTLIACLNGVDIEAELQNASSISVSAEASSATAQKVEEKKEEKTVSESAAGLSSLFG